MGTAIMMRRGSCGDYGVQPTLRTPLVGMCSLEGALGLERAVGFFDLEGHDPTSIN
jgi:hypothetical protein